MCFLTKLRFKHSSSAAKNQPSSTCNGHGCGLGVFFFCFWYSAFLAIANQFAHEINNYSSLLYANSQVYALYYCEPNSTCMDIGFFLPLT